MRNRIWLIRGSLVFLVGYLLFVALYNLGETALWHPDAGREMLEMQKIWEHKDWTQLGPWSGTGSYRMPPLYYHIMLPAFVLGRGEVWIPIIWSGLLVSLTVIPLFLLVRYATDSSRAAIFATYFFAINIHTASLLRSIWSIYPSVLFFATFLLFGSYLQANRRYAWVGFALMTATAWSFHTFIFYLLPAGCLFFLLQHHQKRYKPAKLIAFFGLISLLNLPLITSELTTGGQNLRGLWQDLWRVQTSGGAWETTMTRIQELGRYFLLSTWTVAAPAGLAVMLSSLVILGAVIYLKKNHHNVLGRNALLMACGGYAVVQYLIYRGDYEPRYLLPFWVLLPILFGVGVHGLILAAETNPILKRGSLVLVTLLLLVHSTIHTRLIWQIYIQPNQAMPTRYYAWEKQVADSIAAQAGSGEFDFYNNVHPIRPTDYLYIFSLQRMNYRAGASQLYILNYRHPEQRAPLVIAPLVECPEGKVDTWMVDEMQVIRQDRTNCQQ